ncbi:hypothetical protein ACFL1G_01210 [Planctomycetota bacterium]
MRVRDLVICFVCLALAVTLFIIAGSQLNYINSQRSEMELISSEPLKNAPPSLAFATVALGAFRGLIVDALWIRADELKSQGEFFDAKQLAEWITILQPRFSSVWEFRAWNMAYNISVAIPETQPHERWRWVKNGYELLRDKGIPLNPRSISLYRELGRIFQHKIGGVQDEAHKYYKLQIAKAMEPLLGPADNEYFEALAKAPTEFEEITKDPAVSDFVKALKSADESFDDNDELANRYLALRQNPNQFNRQAFEVIDNFRGTAALQKFDLFAKAYHLLNTWKLNPVLMQQLNQKYGPIDWNDPNTHHPLEWRHPDTHAIYWAVKGLQVAGKEEFFVDQTNTDRIVNHSLQNLFRFGKIYIYDLPAAEQSDPGAQSAAANGRVERSEDIYIRPDLRMFESYNQSVMAILERYKDIEYQGTFESFQIGHRNMLENAVFSFYQAGHEDQARKIYNLLRKLYPREDFNVTLVSFVRHHFLYELQNLEINNAKEMIQMMLHESYFRYAMHDDNEAAARERLAKHVQEYYHDRESDEWRINLPSFNVMKSLALRDFLNDTQFPLELRRNLLGRIKLEKPELFEQLQEQVEKIRQQSQQQQSQ